MTKKINEYTEKQLSAEEVDFWLKTYKSGDSIPDKIYQYYFATSDKATDAAEQDWNNL